MDYFEESADSDSILNGFDAEFNSPENLIEPESQVLNNAIEIRDTIMPDDMVISAVEKACDWFNLPEMPVIDAQQTCVWNGDPGSAFDDVFGFNRNELMNLGIKGEDSLTLVYTHECAHRAMQGHMNDPWEEELACDFFAGLHAGEAGIDTTNFEEALCSTSGGATHPSGALRSEFIQFGRELQYEMMLRNEPLTFENCIKHFNEHLEEKADMIDEYREQDDPNYASFLEEPGARGYIFEDQHSFVNDRDWHLKEAQRAAEREDYTAMNDHIKSAEICTK